ncbi:MAG TPA: hypothetical protein VK666_20105, partial [Chryseolinea sp.]|nr:hypothetical protein [Chryseolinea sp.]
ADITVVVLVPEAGDEIQTMKAGLMEIADIFVVNKSDRPDAELFVRNLRQMLSPVYHRQQREIPVIKTVASEASGVPELMEAILHQDGVQSGERKVYLLTRKAWQMLQRIRMKDFDIQDIRSRLEEKMKGGDFNLVRFVNEVAASKNDR